eukprot:CAMPEP_0177591326 /NCGR_PEP_ID=MMETSP0419_2-20121207/7933_1 /TAXON_ID=582737 /ORGANISM="Tetraselmis sp., Strain GSL018" /LENGTH=522 /DNA_ID=CAMNT_0019082051 /DNA_START=184 /DNA_END=1753 /DNA_ORIENTATION=-
MSLELKKITLPASNERSTYPARELQSKTQSKRPAKNFFSDYSCTFLGFREEHPAEGFGSARREGLEMSIRKAKDLWSHISKGAVALGLSLALSATSVPVSEAFPIVRFPASDNEEVARVQQTMIEAWSIVGQTFFDPELNGTDWFRELSDGLKTAYVAPSREEAYTAFSTMLSKLGDPYTRFAPASDFANFRLGTEAHVDGVGLLVASSDGKLRVVAPLKGGPAERAGIQPGDELLSVNGKSVAGFNGEQVAQLLRGRPGTSVSIRLHRRTSSVPGVAARPDQLPVVRTQQVRMRREAVELHSVYSELLEDDGQNRFGYISINNFSQNVAQDTAEAIRNLENKGATSYILDLRDNAGGLVDSSIDVARLWLDGPAPIFHVRGRDGGEMQDVALQEGAPVTNRPLVVLVNRNSASASEILTGALHDNGRAKILGDHPTFGKGKIQGIYELSDGSALFVTIAKYTTPNNSEIDRVGISPDLGCGLSPTAGPDSARQGITAILGVDVGDDSCVRSAEKYLQAKDA